MTSTVAVGITLPRPARDIWGPGQRVPCIIISPYARKGFVNSNSDRHVVDPGDD